MGFRIVEYKANVKEVERHKFPDVPDHSFRWRIAELRQEITETGETREYFVVKEELEESEILKIKDYVEIISVR
ncbi:MAG: hypothetical protein J7K40_07840 [candidate division Zixibacteria bacterium]|nr:hypothetical protein [candidate division Zixibacteria bacterium]